MTSAEEFVEFAESVSPRLRRTAFLLCGDWFTAEDLVQTALANVFVAWRRIKRHDAAHAYATRTLVNAYFAGRRVKRPSEVLTARLPEQPTEPVALETRLVVLDALAALPPKGRAVVVLRYWDDLSIEQVATALGCCDWPVRLAFSPSGKLVVTADSDGTARLWSAATGREVGAAIKLSHARVEDVAFSPRHDGGDGGLRRHRPVVERGHRAPGRRADQGR